MLIGLVVVICAEAGLVACALVARRVRGKGRARLEARFAAAAAEARRTAMQARILDAKIAELAEMLPGELRPAGAPDRRCAERRGGAPDRRGEWRMTRDRRGGQRRLMAA